MTVHEIGIGLAVAGCLLMLAGVAQLLGLLVRRLIRGSAPAVTRPPLGRPQWSIPLREVSITSLVWGVYMIAMGINLILGAGRVLNLD
jgi:hypothetical protein